MKYKAHKSKYEVNIWYSSSIYVCDLHWSCMVCLTDEQVVSRRKGNGDPIIAAADLRSSRFW